MRMFALFFGFICCISTLNAQKYYTKTGHIHFEASVPSFEEVDAINKTVTAIINVETGEIAALALIQGFRFKVALMEEHFNENYAESSKYPKATFKGNLINFDFNSLKQEAKPFKIEGEISFHGKTQNVSTNALVSLNNKIISLKSEFTLKPEDFGIEVPKVVSNKVAEQVNVSIDLQLSLKK